MSAPIPIFVGFDPREAAAYHVFCQSVIQHATRPVAFIPLHRPLLQNFDGQRDGTNAFIFSRYLVPYLCGFNGWALFVDGDMVVTTDITELWAMRETLAYGKAVGVVQHDYKTRHKRKYIGTPIENDNVDYPRKNWSSVMLFNCDHPANRRLSLWDVNNRTRQELHSLYWLHDDEIGSLDPAWNWLVNEQPKPDNLGIAHFTNGGPFNDGWPGAEHDDLWLKHAGG